MNVEGEPHLPGPGENQGPNDDSSRPLEQPPQLGGINKPEPRPPRGDTGDSRLVAELADYNLELREEVDELTLARDAVFARMVLYARVRGRIRQKLAALSNEPGIDQSEREQLARDIDRFEVFALGFLQAANILADQESSQPLDHGIKGILAKWAPSSLLYD